MGFQLKKVSASEADSFTQFVVDSAEPYRLLPAPVYLLLKRNSKFVTLKAPFDFFTPEEITKFNGAESGLYLNGLAERVAPYREAARRIRSIMSWGTTPAGSGLSPASYEISKEVIQALAPLWGTHVDEPNNPRIESYFAAIFALEFCEPLSAEQIIEARDRDVRAFERAMIQSGVIVFLALHLGYVDPEFLTAARNRILKTECGLHALPDAIIHMEIEQLIRWVRSRLDGNEMAVIKASDFKMGTRPIEKLASRISKVRELNFGKTIQFDALDSWVEGRGDG